MTSKQTEPAPYTHANDRGPAPNYGLQCRTSLHDSGHRTPGMRLSDTRWPLTMRRGLRVVLLFTLLTVLAGCGLPVRLDGSTGVGAQSVEVTDVPASSTPVPLPTETATATSEPTLTPSPTTAPTATATETPTPNLPTDTPAPTEPPTATYPPPPQAVRVPILMYHYISELPPNADQYRRDLTVTPDRFEAQLHYLKEQEYVGVTLSDVYDTLTTGKPLPPRPIVLTFDDGYKDAYTQALPLLQKYGFIGEFFVLATPAHYEAPQYMTWNDMKAMAEAGMSIQAHGRDHYDLTNRAYDFLVYQILGAKEAVEAHTGQPVRFFCYPSGRHDAGAEAVVAGAGYFGAVTTAWGNELRLDNRYTWPRIRVKGAWDLDRFAAVLASLEAGN